MSPRTDHESSEPRGLNRALAIQHSPHRYGPEAAGSTPRPPLAERIDGWVLRSFARAGGPFLKRLCRRLYKKLFGQLFRQHRRTLQLLEMQPLGEKRFVALVRVGKQEFLIGGAASSVSLLAELDLAETDLAEKDTQPTTAMVPRPLGQETA